MRSRERFPGSARVVILCVGMVFLLAAPRARAATPQQVEDAIGRGKEYLYSKMKDGNWEHVPSRDESVKNKFHNDGAQWGMATSIATYALLASGEGPQEPRIKQAVEFLRKAEIVGTYALGMRCQVWSLLPPTPENRLAMRRDLALLTQGSLKEPQNVALFDFTSPAKDKKMINHEVSAYGMMGMKALADAGAEVPQTFWAAADKTWRAHQNTDGGWSYVGTGGGKGKSVESASGAGVTALFITEEFLRQNAGVNCSGNIRDENRERGLKFISNLTLDEKTELHWLYAIQRIAESSALKYFGSMDWYAVISELLVRIQEKDGHWTDIIDHINQPTNQTVGTAYCVTMLAYGRAPLVANKLKYDIQTDGKGEEGFWNERPRDIANVSQWIGRQMERPLSWQIVNFTAPVDELLEAPLLYISGSQTLSFKPEEIEKLKTYVLMGGLIVGNADCGAKAFADSFRQLGQQIFPDYEFRTLSVDHALLKKEQFAIPAADKLKVLVLGNGAREFMVLFSASDPAKSWQLANVAGKEEGFQIMANLFQYAAGKTGLKYKGDSFFIAADPKAKMSRKIDVARLQYEGSWDPEPGGWVRLGNVLRNTRETELNPTPVQLGVGNLDARKFKVAYLTAAGKISLNDTVREEIKNFATAGGTLMVDATGGNPEAAASLESELTKIFGSSGVALPAEDPIYASPIDVGKVKFRGILGARPDGPRIAGVTVNGRVAVYFSKDDLSVGLVGQPIDGVVGYSPNDATEIVTNILLGATSSQPKPPQGPTVPVPETPKPQKIKIF